MSFTSFTGVGNIGDSSHTERIKVNMREFVNWGFLNIGAYFNVNIPTSGSYGGDESRLIPVKDPRYTDGQVWRGFRGNWVWESGITGQSTQPIQVSGVFVDNTFYPVSGGNPTVDYVNGEVVFSTAIATDSVVRAEYSFRWINVYDANDVPWFRDIQYESMKIDTDVFNNYGSGEGSFLRQSKVELPAIIVEVAEGRRRPYSLGAGLQYSDNVVLFHVLAEDGNTADKLADILEHQEEKTIYLFDPDLMAASSVFPLNFDGSIAAGALTYPDLVKSRGDGGYRWRKFRFGDNGIKQKQNKIHDNLYHRPVRFTTELVLTAN